MSLISGLILVGLGLLGLWLVRRGGAWIRAAWDALVSVVTSFAAAFGGSPIATYIATFVVALLVMAMLIGVQTVWSHVTWPNVSDIRNGTAQVAYRVEDVIARNPGWDVQAPPVDERPAGWDYTRAAAIKAMPGHLNGDANPASAEGFWRRCKDGTKNCWEWLAAYAQSGQQNYLGGLFTPQVPALGVKCGQDPAKVQPVELLPGVEYCVYYLRTALVPAH